MSARTLARLRAGALTLSLLLAAPVATAAPELQAGASATPIALFVDPALSSIDREALRRAIEEELATQVVLTDARPSGDALLVLGGAGRTATVSFHGGGRSTERAVELPPDRGAAIDTVAWLAGNVARDEAAELVDELSRRPSPSAAPASASPAQPAASAPSRTAASEGARAQLSACERPLDRVPVGIDFAPYLGMSTGLGTTGVRVASLGAVGSLSGGVRGAEVGGVVALERHFVCGAQVGGVIAATGGEVLGAQIGGVGAFAGDLTGAQVSTVNIARGDVRGAQTGLVSVSRSTTGAQVGLVNVSTGRVRGVQLGLINYAESSDASVGLVSIVKNGDTHVDVRGGEWGVVRAAIEHGGRYLHGVWGMAARLTGDSDAPRGAFVLGLGTHIAVSNRVYVDPDLTSYVFALGGDGVSPSSTVVELAVPIGLRLHRYVSVYVGPSYRVGVAESSDDLDLGPLSHREIYSSGSWHVAGAPGAVVGVRGL